MLNQHWSFASALCARGERFGNSNCGFEVRYAQVCNENRHFFKSKSNGPMSTTGRSRKNMNVNTTFKKCTAEELHKQCAEENGGYGVHYTLRHYL